MKKILVLFLMLLLFTGCTVVRIDTKNIDNMIAVILSKDNVLYNKVGKGYKYYIPRGVTYIDTNDYNDKLYSNGNYYYLYIDAVGYYYQSEVSFEPKEDSYYSKKFNINDKEGYISIQEQENEQYFIEFMYNYAKIETLVSKDQIHDAVLDATYLLSTVKFNHKVIKLLLNEDYFINKEEKYDTFGSQKPSEDFMREEEPVTEENSSKEEEER